MNPSHQANLNIYLSKIIHKSFFQSLVTVNTSKFHLLSPYKPKRHPFIQILTRDYEIDKYQQCSFQRFALINYT